MPSSHVPEPSPGPTAEPAGIPIETVWSEYARFKGIAAQRLAEKAAAEKASALVAPEPSAAPLASAPKSA